MKVEANTKSLRTSSSVKSQSIDMTEDLFIRTLIERSRMNRDIADLAFKKGMTMYFVFMFFAVIGLTQMYITKNFFFALIFMGLGVLMVGAVPYVNTMICERKKLNVILFNLMLRNKNLSDYDESKYVIVKRVDADVKK